MGALCCIRANRYKSDFDRLPSEVVYHILVALSKLEKHPCLINRYRLVCHEWNNLIGDVVTSSGLGTPAPGAPVCLTILVSTAKPDLKLSVDTAKGQLSISTDDLKKYPENGPKRLIINKCDIKCPTVSAMHMQAIAELATTLSNVRELQLFPGEKYSYSPADFRKLLNSCGLSLQTIICQDPRGGSVEDQEEVDHLNVVKNFYAYTSSKVKKDRYFVRLRGDHIYYKGFRAWRYTWTPESRGSAWPNPEKHAERKSYLIAPERYVKLRKNQKLSYFQQLNSFDYPICPSQM
uniref:F-box domain-containing protein n=1 Tax=Steinernema glaseri TaxID=37863 RepID=A0A1I7YJH5_9BILA